MDQNELPLVPPRLGVPLGASKSIYEPMVRLAQTVHLSYIDTNTLSKRIERDSTGPTSPRSSIGCAYGTFDANRALILRQD